MLGHLIYKILYIKRKRQSSYHRRETQFGRLYTALYDSLNLVVAVLLPALLPLTVINVATARSCILFLPPRLPTPLLSPVPLSLWPRKIRPLMCDSYGWRGSSGGGAGGCCKMIIRKFVLVLFVCILLLGNEFWWM